MPEVSAALSLLVQLTLELDGFLAIVLGSHLPE